MPDVLDRSFVRRRAPRQAEAEPPSHPGAGRGDEPYWALTTDRLFERLGTDAGGLTSAEAEVRLRRDGPNRVRSRASRSRARVLLAQLESPLLLLLLFAAVVSGFTGEWVDAAIVFLIVGASVGIGYQREYAAQNAAEALERRLRSHASVMRDRRLVSRPLEEVVAGDVVTLGAGSLVPGDGVVLDATDFFVSEAALTGESFPVEKHPGVSAPAAPIAARTNCVYLGTHVRSGCATCLIARTGGATEFGAIAARVTLRRPLTEFDRGIQRFGYFLTTAMLVMVLLVFLAHVMRGRPAVETLLFAVALAVGLSPELLPAILSVNLARGARSMADAGVLVRRLSAIENLGSMDVLCTDKTGTLTEGVIRLEGAYDTSGTLSPHVLALAGLNAALQTGPGNPLDEAILAAHQPELADVEKLGEVPFDFVRRRTTVILGSGGRIQLVTKGAFREVLEASTHDLEGRPLGPDERRDLIERHDRWAADGIRVLAVAVTTLDSVPARGRAAESDLAFAGFLTFLDRPKAGAANTLAELSALGVSVKLVTGDSRLVAAHVAQLVGMRHDTVVAGQELRQLSAEALWHVAARTDIFAEVDPIQKEAIIRALRASGHVVGFLGDGANDASAMHVADTSLSVMEAVDVAREAADFVLLQRDLDVIRRGILEGRKTFANTLKYILTTTSANLGNMTSMAVASVFLPFLPLTAGQILLNNFLSDIPAVGLADDAVDPELVATPQRWNMRFIGRFMLEFGALSSAFDALTFALLLAYGTSPVLFRTGWFVESLLTELAIALVVRTRRPFFRSRPGTLLSIATAVLILVAVTLPYVPAAATIGFTPLPPPLLLMVCLITVAYVAAAEIMKRWFFRAHPRRVPA